jgi:crotonobetainyl-CoA:carnitine CoA-transferase CaiB-like acyl-CoA transferase
MPDGALGDLKIIELADMVAGPFCEGTVHRPGDGGSRDVDAAGGVADFTMNGRDRGRQGNRDDVMVPHNVYRCAGGDQWAAIAVNTEGEWRSLCENLGHPEWCADARFKDRPSRKAHEEELDGLIAAWTVARSPLDVMHTLLAAGVAATPVNNTEALCNDPQFLHRNYSVAVEHSVTGRSLLPGFPVYSARRRNRR